MRRLWKRHSFLVLTFMVTCLVAMIFAGRLIWATIYWAEHRQEAVQPWMTMGYIGRSWQLDPHDIDRVSGLAAPQGQRLTLQEIAKERGQPVEEIIAEIEAAIVQLRAATVPSQ